MSNHIQRELVIKLKVSCTGNSLEKAIQELKSLINNPIAKSILRGRGVQILEEPDISVKED